MFRKTLTTHSQIIDPTTYLAQGRSTQKVTDVDLPLPTIPPQPLQILTKLTTFFKSIPGLDSQYEQIYADVRGSYLSNSLSDISAAVLSSAQGRPGQSMSPGVLVRASVTLLEVPPSFGDAYSRLSGKLLILLYQFDKLMFLPLLHFPVWVHFLERLKP